MIHIACNIDSNFTVHCTIALAPLFEDNREPEFCIHIVASTLLSEDKEVLKIVAGRYGSEVRFYFPPEDLLYSFSIKKLGKCISMATYHRCMLPAILPGEVDKVLYLDCDIVILRDIPEYWSTDMSNYSVVCVEDIGSNEGECYDILKYDKSSPHFNVGVLLINLRYWREHRIDEQCEQYFLRCPERIRFNDQDLLNAVLHGSKFFVPLKWNMQDGFYRYGADKGAKDKKQLHQQLLRPVILYYVNRKPWNYDSIYPLKEEYFKYLDMTPWKGRRPLSTFKAHLSRRSKLLPYAMWFRKPKYMKL